MNILNQVLHAIYMAKVNLSVIHNGVLVEVKMQKSPDTVIVSINVSEVSRLSEIDF